MTKGQKRIKSNREAINRFSFLSTTFSGIILYNTLYQALSEKKGGKKLYMARKRQESKKLKV